MGKKGGWLSALKKAFTSGPKEKPTNVQLVAQFPQQQRSSRDKKRWSFGRSRQHAEPAPAGALINIPLYREPSSIEKILGDAEMERKHRQYHARAQYQVNPAKPTTVTAAAAAAPARERERDDYKPALVLPLPPPSPPPLIRRFDHDREHQQVQQSRAESEWRRQQPRRHPAPSRPRAARQGAAQPDRARAAAVTIQAAFRGYMARRSYRSLRGLIRLRGVMRGPGVRRQTAHAMRCMQMLVRVQLQVRASRVGEAMERRNRHHHHGAMLRDGGRWRAGSQDGGVWNNSLLSRVEVDARMKRKVEAVIKRERALAYAYSHQLLKATPMAAHAILADLQSGRSPWCSTPIERRHEPDFPRHAEPIVRPKINTPAIAHRQMTAMTTAAATTPVRSVVSSYSKPRPARATKGGPPPSSHGCSIRDDESLTSCPAFGVPNYMTPTVSASAKARARAYLLQQKPRLSFGHGQSIGSWAKSPFWKGNGQSESSPVGTPAASVANGRHRPTRSVSGLSVDSAVSMPGGSAGGHSSSVAPSCALVAIYFF